MRLSLTVELHSSGAHSGLPICTTLSPSENQIWSNLSLPRLGVLLPKASEDFSAQSGRTLWSSQELEKALIDSLKFESLKVTEVLLDAGVDPDCDTLAAQSSHGRRYEISPS